MTATGHERRFRDARDESGLPPTPERLRQRSEPTLRAIFGHGDTIPSREVAQHARPAVVFFKLRSVLNLAFESTAELQRQVLASFAFGMTFAAGRTEHLTPPEVHALSMLMDASNTHIKRERSQAA
jgi:hypothetical protein